VTKAWASANPSELAQVKMDWNRVQKAYAILSDEELRARYDSGKLQARSAKGM